MNIDIFSPEVKVYIDVEAGLYRIRNNKSLYKRMLQMFAQSAEFGAFEEALQQGDIARAAEVAHAIKGVSGNLGINEIYKLATRLCDEMRNGICDSALVDSYRETLGITLDYIQEIIEALD